MASRLLVHLRAGASAAARSAHGHHLPAGRTWAPAMAPSIGALADAGRIPAIQGVRHYGKPSNHITEMNRAMREVERRLGAFQGKSDVGHKPLAHEALKQTPHEKEPEHRFPNVVMAVGCSITVSVIMFYRFPWHFFTV